MTKEEEPPFGALAPGPVQMRIRALAARLPDSYPGRKIASLLLGPAGGRARRAYDVEIFGTQKARLHPYDNICEKRVYLTPQHWDRHERALLAKRIAQHPRPDFTFADIGANVGLYTLFARARAHETGKKFYAVCIEPDPEMRARLQFNLGASGAEDEVSVLPFAATPAEGPARFSVNKQSRGMSRIAESGEIEVEGRTLARLLSDRPRIDAMKIDIEGAEYPVLDAFFRTAPESLRPGMLILETSHDQPGAPAKALVESKGYEIAFENALNTVLVSGRDA